MDSVPKTSRQLQAELTKRNIFDAAMRLLDTVDFEQITIREIVKEANVSTGSFYHYYSSKMDVFYETYEIADSYFDEKVRPQLTQQKATDRILFFFSEYAKYSSVYTTYKLTKLLYNADNTWFHRSGSSMLSILTGLCREAKESGEFSTEKTPEEIAVFLMVCARGIVYDWCLEGGTGDLAGTTGEYVGLLLSAFE